MKEQINITGAVARSMATSLQELLSRLKTEKVELETKISQVERDLSALGHKVNLGKKSRRRKWGQNRLEIQDFLNTNPMEHFTSDEIAGKLTIPRSSALATLQRLEKDGLVERTPEGLWMKKINQ